VRKGARNRKRLRIFRPGGGGWGKLKECRDAKLKREFVLGKIRGKKKGKRRMVEKKGPRRESGATDSEGKGGKGIRGKTWTKTQEIQGNGGTERGKELGRKWISRGSIFTQKDVGYHQRWSSKNRDEFREQNLTRISRRKKTKQEKKKTRMFPDRKQGKKKKGEGLKRGGLPEENLVENTVSIEFKKKYG